MMHGCLNCISDVTCTKCSVGKIVAGGCSSVSGCIRVDAQIADSPCVACDTS